jgi:hypothetical protein
MSSGALFRLLMSCPEAGIADRDDCLGDARLLRDQRVARREAAHLTVGTVLLGAHSFAGATIEGDDRCSGRVWGPTHEARFANEGTSAVVAALGQVMPADGESRMEAAEIYAHVFCRITELCAGSEAEQMHFGDCWPASDDRKQEMELTRLICSSSESSSALIAACTVEAREILCRHAHVVDALTDALVRHRTLDAKMISETISTAVARKLAADEAERRRQWARRIENAKNFRGCDG